MAVQRYDPVSDLTPTTTAKVDLVTLVQLYPVSYPVSTAIPINCVCIVCVSILIAVACNL